MLKHFSSEGCHQNVSVTESFWCVKVFYCWNILLMLFESCSPGTRLPPSICPTREQRCCDWYFFFSLLPWSCIQSWGKIVLCCWEAFEMAGNTSESASSVEQHVTVHPHHASFETLWDDAQSRWCCGHVVIRGLFLFSLNDALLNDYEMFLVHTFTMNYICTSSRYWLGKWPASLWRPKVLRRRLLWQPTAVILTHWSGGSYVFWVSYVTRKGKHQFPSLYFMSTSFIISVFISSDLFKTEWRPVSLWSFTPTQLAAVNPFNPHFRWSYWLVPIFWFSPPRSLLSPFFNFLPGVYSFGLFATTIFANAGQVVTGHQTPHFLTACKPNYTALGCQSPLQYITEHRACTGNPYLVVSARKSFPSKDAALSFYSAVYTVVGNVWWLESKKCAVC